MNVRDREDTKWSERRSSELKPTDSDSEIEFEGEQSPGIKIPGGLREPSTGRRVPKGRYVEGYGSGDSEETLARSSQRIGADKHIEFEGEQSPGIKIPGGLREPGEPPEQR